MLGDARILHLSTSIPNNPEEGTLVYGVTKAAFLRLGHQLNVEPALRKNGVVCSSLSPGMAPTEDTTDKVENTQVESSPLVKYIDEALAKGWTTPMEGQDGLLAFVDHLMSMDAEAFAG